MIFLLPPITFFNKSQNVLSLRTVHRVAPRHAVAPVQIHAPAQVAPAIHPVLRPHRRVIPIAVRRTDVEVVLVQPAKIILALHVGQASHHAPIARLARNPSVSAIVCNAVAPDPENAHVKPPMTEEAVLVVALAVGGSGVNAGGIIPALCNASSLGVDFFSGGMGFTMMRGWCRL